MKTYFIAMLLFISINSIQTFAQDPILINQRFMDDAGNPVLVGKCTRDVFREEPFSKWYWDYYNTYRVDTATCSFLAPLLKDKKITIFLGTWCGDSKRQVPAILKMLDCCNFPMENLTLIMVSNQPDLYKQSPQHEEQGKQIVRVPTVIIEEKQVELGRIIEYPLVSLEKDMLGIVRKERTKPTASR